MVCCISENPEVFATVYIKLVHDELGARPMLLVAQVGQVAVKPLADSGDGREGGR